MDAIGVFIATGHHALLDEYKYLVFIRTDDKTDETYRVATAESEEEVLGIIAEAAVGINRIMVTRPCVWKLEVT